MTNLTIVGPVHRIGHPPHWAAEHSKQESWREQSSPSSERDMPDTSDTPSPTSKSPSTSLASKALKRTQAKDRARKPQEENKTGTENSRLTPNNARSPSVSPKSPSVTLPQVPSSRAGSSPHPDFPSPASLNSTCFSPVPMGGLGIPGLPGTLGAMGLFGGDAGRNPANSMPRSCSDLMRSMAAKYNNNTNSPLQFYANTPLNGYHRPPIQPVAFSSTGFLPNLPSDGTSSPIQSQRTIESHIKTPESSPKRSVAGGGLSAGIPQHLLSPNNFAGLGSNPLLELSSTQVLINMVRNASTLHQNQLHKTSSEIQNQQKFQNQLLLQHQQQLHQQQLQQQKDKLQSFQKQINADESRQSLKMLENSRGLKRPAHSSSPLDLSAAVPSKYARTSESDINVEDDETPVPRTSQDDDTPAPRTSPAVTISPVHVKNEQPCRSPCQRNIYPFETKENSLTWSVDDVYDFVRSIDICAEYAENFRDQRIDGACLLLLSESHLTGSLKMKLGPALKLRSFLALRNQAQQPSFASMPHYPGSPRSCTHCNSNTINNNNNYGFNQSLINNNNNNNGLTDHHHKKQMSSSFPEASPPQSRSSAVSPESGAPSLSSPLQTRDSGSPMTLDARQSAAVE